METIRFFCVQLVTKTPFLSNKFSLRFGPPIQLQYRDISCILVHTALKKKLQQKKRIPNLTNFCSEQTKVWDDIQLCKTFVCLNIQWANAQKDSNKTAPQVKKKLKKRHTLVRGNQTRRLTAPPYLQAVLLWPATSPVAGHHH